MYEIFVYFINLVEIIEQMHLSGESFIDTYWFYCDSSP